MGGSGGEGGGGEEFPTHLKRRIDREIYSPEVHRRSALHMGCLGKASLEMQAFFSVDFETPAFENASQQNRAVQHPSAAGMDIGTWLQWLPNWEFHTSCTIWHHHSRFPPCAGSSWCAGCTRIFASWELVVRGWKKG